MPKKESPIHLPLKYPVSFPHKLLTLWTIIIIQKSVPWDKIEDHFHGKVIIADDVVPVLVVQLAGPIT